MRENAELKAAMGHGVHCNLPDPSVCGRAQIICTKDGPCVNRIEDGVRCDGFDGPCMRMDAKRRRQNTQYTDEGRNWATFCPECQAAADDYWKERWDEYRSGQGV
jgi:hypothetical protein